MSNEEIVKKYPIGTIVKVLSFPAPKTSDDVKVIDFLKKVNPNGYIAKIIGYTGEDKFILSHSTNKGTFILPFNSNNFTLIDPNQIESHTWEYDFTNPCLSADSFTKFLYEENEYYFENFVSLENDNSISITVSRTIPIPNSPLFAYESKLVNSKSLKLLNYEENRCNIASGKQIIIDEEFKKVLIEYYTPMCNKHLAYIIVNSPFNYKKSIGKDKITLTDSILGQLVVADVSKCMNMYDYVTINNANVKLVEKKFKTIKCLKNKGTGKALYKLTINKEYKVLKWTIDETTSKERVIILNDNNIEKSYDPKLFKGIE